MKYPRQSFNRLLITRTLKRWLGLKAHNLWRPKNSWLLVTALQKLGYTVEILDNGHVYLRFQNDLVSYSTTPGETSANLAYAAFNAWIKDPCKRRILSE